MIYVMSGGAKAYALIGVLYPSGNTCTCTNGTKTLSAENNSGSWVFEIPSAGTWTITVGSKSVNVSITAKGQKKVVEIALDLVLFDGANGGDNTAVTGGWNGTATGGSTAVGNTGTVTVGTNKLTVKATCGSSTYSCTGYGYTAKTIDITDITTLYASISSITTTDQYTTGNFKHATLYIGSSPTTMVASKQTTSTGTITLDVSEYTGKFYIGVETYCHNIGTSTVEATKIWGV